MAIMYDSGSGSSSGSGSGSDNTPPRSLRLRSSDAEYTSPKWVEVSGEGNGLAEGHDPRGAHRRDGVVRGSKVGVVYMLWDSRAKRSASWWKSGPQCERGGGGGGECTVGVAHPNNTSLTYYSSIRNSPKVPEGALCLRGVLRLWVGWVG